MFIDSATIHVRSGKGGDGCVSFLRMKYVPKGGPNGGDGGRGGDVYLLADPNVLTLIDFAGRHHWHARSGSPGEGKQKHGKDSDDLIIKLPPGTAVHNDDTGELMVDLKEPGQRVLIAKGGRGGFGNEHFKSPTNQVPREATPGEPYEEYTLRLELKLMADVGLIGKPNAGKSTLLSRISRAEPKIADYPFTTLTPQLGIAELSPARRLVVADIPGLIENAHTGAGLGTRFLRHVERTRTLVHLLEPEPLDGSDPVENYRVIRKELEAHSPELAAKDEIVVLSKSELITDSGLAERVKDELGVESVMTISSATGENLDLLLESCWQMLGKQETAGWKE